VEELELVREDVREAGRFGLEARVGTGVVVGNAEDEAKVPGALTSAKPLLLSVNIQYNVTLN
jgi:hypothetical protein